ncbi:hypothetical protein F5888DRAFT_1807128 [Russula emetica]|nr:hypothetical protein F5888DRAFT_1807128 [Russula emetica]
MPPNPKTVEALSVFDSSSIASEKASSWCSVSQSNHGSQTASSLSQMSRADLAVSLKSNDCRALRLSVNIDRYRSLALSRCAITTGPLPLVPPNSSSSDAHTSCLALSVNIDPLYSRAAPSPGLALSLSYQVPQTPTPAALM